MGHAPRLVPLSLRAVPALRVLLICASTGCAGAGMSGSPTPAEIPALESQAAARPADVAAALRLASAYRQADRLPEARAALERVVQRDPKNPTAVLLLGATLEDLRLYRDAGRLYEQYLEVARDRRMRGEVRGRLALIRRQELAAAVRESLAREATLRNAEPKPRTVAVFPFLYTGDDATLRPLSRALAEMLSTDLSQTERLTVLERTQVQMLLDEMQLGASGAIEPATAVRGGHLLGAERVIQGAISGGQAALNLDASVIRIAAAQDAAAEQRTVSERDAVSRLFDLEKRLAFAIYTSLGVELAPAERERVNRRATENLQALLAYGLGLEAADAGKYQEAAQHFNRAAGLDPSFAAARQQAQESAQIAAAAQVSTQQLAEQALAEVAPVLDPTLAIEAIIPSVERRDAAAESLGQEGLGQNRTILELIIRRP